MLRVLAKPARGASRDRIQAYLSAEDMAQINRLRGQFLSETGKDVRITQVFRAAIKRFMALDWPEKRRCLEDESATREP